MTASDMQHEIEVLKLKLKIKELEAELSSRNAPPQQLDEELKERRSWSWPNDYEPPTYPPHYGPPYSGRTDFVCKASTEMPIVGEL